MAVVCALACSAHLFNRPATSCHFKDHSSELCETKEWCRWMCCGWKNDSPNMKENKAPSELKKRKREKEESEEFKWNEIGCLYTVSTQFNWISPSRSDMQRRQMAKCFHWINYELSAAVAASSVWLCGQLSNWMLSMLRLRHHQFPFLIFFCEYSLLSQQLHTVHSLWGANNPIRPIPIAFLFSSNIRIDSCASFSPLFRVQPLFSLSAKVVARSISMHWAVATAVLAMPR